MLLTVAPWSINYFQWNFHFQLFAFGSLTWFLSLFLSLSLLLSLSFLFSLSLFFVLSFSLFQPFTYSFSFSYMNFLTLSVATEFIIKCSRMLFSNTIIIIMFPFIEHLLSEIKDRESKREKEERNNKKLKLTGNK